MADFVSQAEVSTETNRTLARSEGALNPLPCLLFSIVTYLEQMIFLQLYVAKKTLRTNILA